MNIGINASALSAVKGGASFYICNMVDALAQEDTINQYFIFTTDASKDQFRNLPPNFQIIPCAPSKTLARLIWEQTILPFALCKKYKVETLFSPNYTAPVIHPGFASVVTIHDLSFFPLADLYPRSRRIFKQIIQLSVRFSDKVISVSNFTRNDILKYIGHYGNKIHVIHPPLNPRFFDEPSSERVTDVLTKYKIDRDYVLFIGFLEPRKNLERLLQAYSTIKDDVRHSLVIVGGNGWWYEQTYKRVQELGISDRVVFTGYADDSDMPSFYRGASLFAFPSLYEGFGIVALEAVYLDTPVLASNNSALPEALGDAAAYVDPYNIEEIAETMKRLLNSEKELRTLKKNCDAIKARYSWRKVARETLDVFYHAKEKYHE